MYSNKILEPATGPYRPLLEADFTPVARQGLGDPGNAYVHSMAWFRDHLYIGMNRYVYLAVRPYDLGREFEMFPVKVPDPTRRLELVSQGQAQIWRLDPQTFTWENIYVSPLCMGKKGFQVARHIGFRAMTVFQGSSDPEPALYTNSWGSHMGEGPFILRCFDGKHFEEVGVSDRQYFGTQTLRPLVAFKGRIYTAPAARESGTDGAHDYQGGVVLESRDPMRGGWIPVSEPHFGDLRNVMFFDMATFNGFLYVGTMNPYEGYQIWKTDAEGKPPYRWIRVISQGAYRGKLNEVAASFGAFKDSLYVGSAIYAGGYDRIYNVGPGCPELIRVYPDDSWDLIVGEPRLTPEGLKVPLSGLGPGFNNPFAGYIWRMCTHQGWLYASTLVWSPWLPFSRRKNWPEIAKRILHPARVEKLLRDFGGFDLWRTRDGCRWMPVTLNGFGNPYNCGARTMVSTPFGLFIGTANQFGPEVAVKRVAGWRYEPNRKSGAEVWLGTHEPLKKEITIVPLETSLGEDIDLSSEIEIELGDNDLLNDFYDHSCWRHVGFWRLDVRSAKEACENLIEELIAFTRPPAKSRVPCQPTEEEIKDWLERRSHGENTEVTEDPLKHETILDVGCGLGATTRYLLKYFAPHRAIGVTNNKEDLRYCQKSVPGPRFIFVRFPKLKFAANTFDKVICVEGPYRYGDRAKLLQEIYRVLKPGGQMVCSDMLFLNAEKNCVRNATEYGKLLEKVGFKEMRIVDVTKKCVEPFHRHTSKFLLMKSLSRKINSETIQNILKSLPGGGEPISCYLLIWGAKKHSETSPYARPRGSFWRRLTKLSDSTAGNLHSL